MEFINNFLKTEVNFIIFIQNKFFQHENLLGHFSTFFGPTFLYLYVIPLLAAFHTKLYHRVLLSCVISDFVNLILKWIISEDRPYWWVHETKAYTSLTRPTLYQTERTCETSPGSPSGHMMLAGCFMHLIYDEINRQIEKNVENSIKLRILNRIFFIVILTLTAISRMYFAAHFLHQCIFGCLLGIIISIIINRSEVFEEILNFGKLKWLKIAILMSTSTTVIFWLHKLISGSPMASVQLAFKYCTDPLFPKPETTVIFSAIRAVGLIFGFMINAPLKKRETKLDIRFSFILTAALIIAQAYVISSTPKTYKIIVFYSYTFIMHALFQSLFMFLIPKLCSEEITVRSKEKKKN